MVGGDREAGGLRLDEPPNQIQRWINETAPRTRTPCDVSGYAGSTLLVGTFVPVATPCSPCFDEDQTRQRRARDGEPEVPFAPAPPNAAIAPTSNLSGHLAALEAVDFLAELRPQLLRRRVVLTRVSGLRIALTLPGCGRVGPRFAGIEGD